MRGLTVSDDSSHLIIDSLNILLNTDSDIWHIVIVSLSVSLSALSIALLPALIVGYLLFFNPLLRHKAWLVSFRTLQSFPTVVVGLILYLSFSRQGFLGDFNLLFTTRAMIIAQILLAFPILVTLSYSAFRMLGLSAMETAVSLGLHPLRRFLLLAWECRVGLVTAVVTALARIITEVGCAMMVGGNIYHLTRNIPTAIALQTAKGEFAQGIALGIIMLFIALLLNTLLSSLDGSQRERCP